MRISKQTFFLEIFPLVTSKLQVIKSLLRAHFLFNQQTTHKVKLGGPEKIYVFTFKCFTASRLAKLDNLNIQERIMIIELSKTPNDSIIMNTGILIAILDNFCSK